MAGMFVYLFFCQMQLFWYPGCLGWFWNLLYFWHVTCRGDVCMFSECTVPVCNLGDVVSVLLVWRDIWVCVFWWYFLCVVYCGVWSLLSEGLGHVWVAGLSRRATGIRTLTLQVLLILNAVQNCTRHVMGIARECEWGVLRSRDCACC